MDESYRSAEFRDWCAQQLCQLRRWKQRLKTRVEIRHQVDSERSTHASEVIVFLRRERAFINPATIHEQCTDLASTQQSSNLHKERVDLWRDKNFNNEKY